MARILPDPAFHKWSRYTPFCASMTITHGLIEPQHAVSRVTSTARVDRGDLPPAAREVSGHRGKGIVISVRNSGRPVAFACREASERAPVNSDTTRSGDLEAGPTKTSFQCRDGARRPDRMKRRLPLRRLAAYASINSRLLGKATPMFAHTVRRYAVTGLVIGALTLSTAGCADDGDPETAPTDSPTSSATDSKSEPTTDPTPTTDPNAWRTKFSPAQLQSYDMALQRWETYESRSEPIWARGEATLAAEKLFKEFFPHPAWRGYLDRLETYEEVEVKSEGLASVYWSKARSISKQGDSVQIVQCVDYTTIDGTQRGEPVTRPAWLEKPQLRKLFLSRPEGYDWLIYGVVDAQTGKSAPCKP